MFTNVNVDFILPRIFWEHKNNCINCINFDSQWNKINTHILFVSLQMFAFIMGSVNVTPSMPSTSPFTKQYTYIKKIITNFKLVANSNGHEIWLGDVDFKFQRFWNLFKRRWNVLCKKWSRIKLEHNWTW